MVLQTLEARYRWALGLCAGPRVPENIYMFACSKNSEEEIHSGADTLTES